MIERSFDIELVKGALNLYPFEPIELDVETWLSNTNNIALQNEIGDLALFEALPIPGVYDGHYFFTEKTRGLAAIKLAEKILEHIKIEYGAKTIRGFTPVKHKGAARISRRLGFQDMGLVDTEIGPCILFVKVL